MSYSTRSSIAKAFHKHESFLSEAATQEAAATHVADLNYVLQYTLRHTQQA
jgi:hypothetical protein